MTLSVLGKEMSKRIQIEYRKTKLNKLRISEIKDSIVEKESKIDGIADLYRRYQESQEIDLKMKTEIIKALSNKFKEYIIDEDEADIILKLVEIALKFDQIHLYDRIDLVYKYARLYFKCLDKQYYLESRTNMNEHAKDEKESIESKPKRYLEVTNWLYDCIERILDENDRDVT